MEAHDRGCLAGRHRVHYVAFIAQLAFRDPEIIEQTKIGILLGSAISAAIGLVWLYCAGSVRREAIAHPN